MLRNDGYVKVVDFGLAKLAAPLSDLEATILSGQTRAGTIAGTVDYMSPEQARGVVVDHRADIFSLGVVLYEMVAGRCPFEAATPMDTILAILQQDPAAVGGTRRLPGDVEGTIRKTLEKDPDARYQTAGDLLRDLRRVRKELDQSWASARADHVSPAARDDLTRKPSAAPHVLGGRRAVTLAIGAVLTLIALSIGFWRTRLADHGVREVTSIAVLPFDYAGNSADAAYLGDGITEGLINSLSQLPNLRVMSRNAVFRYKSATRILNRLHASST
jgi:serine/threonine protein kinase